MMVVVGRSYGPTKMLYLKIMLVGCLVRHVFSDSDSEPRYLDKFSLKFGTPKPKRQSQDDLEVSSIIGELLREQEDGRFENTRFAEDRTFPGEDLVRKGAKDLSDDIHAILSDILDGAEAEEEREGQRHLNSVRQQLSQEEKRILQSLRDIEEEEEQRDLTRKPIRFRDSKESTGAIFTSSFAEQGLRTQEERENTNSDNVPNLANRGRFNPSAPKPKPKPIPSSNSRERGSRQRATCK